MPWYVVEEDLKELLKNSYAVAGGNSGYRRTVRPNLIFHRGLNNLFGFREGDTYPPLSFISYSGHVEFSLLMFSGFFVTSPLCSEGCPQGNPSVRILIIIGCFFDCL